jgi:hypothetical protein
LDRQFSHASGIFFDDDGEDNPQEPQLRQTLGKDKSTIPLKRPSTGSLRVDRDDSFRPASMANFYYHKSNSYDNMRIASDANLNHMGSASQLHRTGRSGSVSSQHENFF